MVRRSAVSWAEGVVVGAVALAGVACSTNDAPVSASTPVTMLEGPPTDGRTIREIDVTGQLWRWGADYEGGHVRLDGLVLGVGETVHLSLTSKDVVHVFEIPELSVRAEVVPGQTVDLWLEVTAPFATTTRCVSRCEVEGAMLTDVRAIPSVELDELIARELGPVDDESWAVFGARTYDTFGCIACHPVGRQGVGPNLAGVFGSKRTVVGGRVVLADEAYLRRAIVDPVAEVTVGYSPTQPSYDGQLDENQLRGLITLLMCWGDPHELARLQRIEPGRLDCSGV